MQEKVKLIIIAALIGLLAISAFVCFRFYATNKAIGTERDSLKTENATLNSKIDEIAKERRALEDKVRALTDDLSKISDEKHLVEKEYDSLVKERDSLAEKIKSLQRDNEQLHSDLNNVISEKERLGQNLKVSLEPVKEENARLKKQLDEFNSIKSKLENELGQLKGEKSALEQRFSEIDSFLGQNLSKSKYLSIKGQLDAIRSGQKIETGQLAVEPVQADNAAKGSIELPPIVVRPKGAGVEDTPVAKEDKPVKPSGTILEINKENKFVIIDLGQEAGVKAGDSFQVYKQGSAIAIIEVIQVRQDIAACDIKEEKAAIAVGDTVK